MPFESNSVTPPHKAARLLRRFVGLGARIMLVLEYCANGDLAVRRQGRV